MDIDSYAAFLPDAYTATLTPPEVSIRYLQRISGPTELVTLENCGHFPIEEPGLTQLRDAFTGVVARVGRR
ncbi:hypothetical protein ACQI4F_11010 [Mycolicibacterium vaccae]|uniref:hypothetical protein n=1 Tax=Mycolicibacterium vaccae TaxID=1810 RepID=UPI003CE92D6A